MNIANNSSTIGSKEFIMNCVDGIDCQLSQLGLSERKKRSDDEYMTRLGLKQCPICKNKLHSSVLLVEHLKVKHPNSKSFRCNVCTKKYLKGAAAFVNHVDLCHDSSNVRAEDSKPMPFVKTVSKNSNSVACNQIQLIVCERHGKTFPTNYLADRHRIYHGNATKPCFMLLVQGIVGSSEEISLPLVNENYNKIRLDGFKKFDYEEYKNLKFEYSFPVENTSSKNELDLIKKETQDQPTRWIQGSWNMGANVTSLWGVPPSELSERDEMFSLYVNPRSPEPQPSYSQYQASQQNRYNNIQPNGL